MLMNMRMQYALSASLIFDCVFVAMVTYLTAAYTVHSHITAVARQCCQLAGRDLTWLSHVPYVVSDSSHDVVIYNQYYSVCSIINCCKNTNRKCSLSIRCFIPPFAPLAAGARSPLGTRDPWHCTVHSIVPATP